MADTASVTTDIDIDFSDRAIALAGLTYVSASRDDKDGRIRHPTGVYFQDIPIDPFCNAASIPYLEAARLGYFKIDFLNNTLYDGVRDEAHLDDLLNREAPWDLLEERGIVSMLAHIGEHFGVVQSIRPKSIEDLAVVLALIRPGKRHLLMRPRAEIDAQIWASTDEYSFKKSHSIAYAASIVVQLNLLVEKATDAIDEESMDVDGLLLPL